MANISEDMASEDLNRVKFLLSSTLPREKIEKAKVGEKNLTFESQLFPDIEKPLLVCVCGKGVLVSSVTKYPTICSELYIKSQTPILVSLL